MNYSNLNISKIIAENRARLKVLNAPYDPVTGQGSAISRQKVVISSGLPPIYLPVDMVAKVPMIKESVKAGSVQKMIKQHARRDGVKYSDDMLEQAISIIMEKRLDFDFEYWAFTAVFITDKDSGKMVPFKLNLPQRFYLSVLERERLLNKPIRAIITKARQWGGSTLTQIYFGWIQNRLKLSGWGSVIVTHVENQARNVRNMYTKFAQHYPDSIGTITLQPYEGSNKTRYIKERNAVLDITSTESPESTRSFDYAMAHLSEVGLWRGTLLKKPEDMVQNIRAGIKKVPYSVLVMESTAKGVGNFFHREWQAAKSGKSGYAPVFVPWHSFPGYKLHIDEVEYPDFIKNMSNDDWSRWNQGATLEGIHWYNTYREAENYDKWRMESEFPGDDDEAFQSTGNVIFHRAFISNMERHCMAASKKGDLTGKETTGKEALRSLSFENRSAGNLWIWAEPDTEVKVKNRYVVSVDIGGTTEGADWSVIRVFDRYWILDGGVPEAVATWRGHIDQDLLAWKAAQIATWYNKALLVIESNSLKKDTLSSDGSHFLTVLDEISDVYDNLYSRTRPEKVVEGAPVMWGFHTNTQTKTLVVDALRAKLRNEGYIERDARACAEFKAFQQNEDGTMGAVDGMHDDIVMSTAIGLYVSDQMAPPVEYIPKTKAERHSARKKFINEATF